MSSSFNSLNQEKQFIEPNEQDTTPAALLEQLIYVDSFMPDADPTSFDNQLTAELAAFADDSFIFPDEEKPKNNGHDDLNDRNNNNINFNDHTPLNLTHSEHDPNNVFINSSDNLLPGSQTLNNAVNEVKQNEGNAINPDLLSQSLVTILSSQGSTHNSVIDSLSTSLLSNVPKVYVPPGALASLTSAGLSQIQIDALAALIAQHQSRASNGTVENSGNENVGFHDSAVSALSGFTSNSNTINNFTPIQQRDDQQQQHINAPLSNLVSILNANSPRPLQQVSHQDQEGSSIYQGQPLLQMIKSSPQSTIIPSPTSTTTPDGVKLEFNTPGMPASSNGSSDAADSDKRRRNTAASARFRIKKKLKQQEMERNIRDLNENSQKLQMRIQQLEMENRLLRNLVVEKGAQKNDDELERLKQRAREGI